MKYRSCSHDDIDHVIELWHRCGLGGDRDVDRAEIVERLLMDDDLFVVASDENETVVATAMGCYDNHRGWVKRFAVDPSMQRAGVGSALVAELERRFTEAGITKLRLAVWGHNETGVAFWADRGYEEMREVRYFVKNLGTGSDDGC